MDINAERLREKGWSEAEIKHAQKIVSKAKRHKHPHQDLLNETIFWGMLTLAAGTMVAVTYWIIPLFIFSSSSILYPIIIIIGLTFGVLISHVLKDLDHLKLHHHVILIATLPITGIISFLGILGKIDDAVLLGGTVHNVLLSSIIFIISFLLPYFYHLHHKRRT